MDLIAQVTGAVLAFFASIIGNIFAHDICASADVVCAKIIKAAAALLAPLDPTPTEQEWLADLHERQTVSEKYRHAIGCFLVAPRMRRYAINVPPPLVESAPGFVWVQRKGGVWEGRWRSSAEALAMGYKTKSVKLFATRGHDIDAGQKEIIAATSRELQADQDQWMNDPNYRSRLEAEKETRDRQIKELMALGHTRADAINIAFGLKSAKKEEPQK
jgi:hypothetical protein